MHPHRQREFIDTVSDTVLLKTDQGVTMEKYNMIAAAEEQFAREVTLGVIVQRPLTSWYYILPGMFIIDFLRRGSTIRRYTKHFMFPRNLALTLARDLAEGKEKKDLISDVAADINAWLQTMNLDYPRLIEAQGVVVDSLADHYLKLIRSEGDDYHQLIWNAYQTRVAFQSHLSRLSDAEKNVDQAILEIRGYNEKIKEKLSLEEQQVEMRRKKLADEIF